MLEVQPRFKIPSRMTMYRDLMKLHMLERTKLMYLLSMNNQMVSLTTDIWTSIQNMSLHVCDCSLYL